MEVKLSNDDLQKLVFASVTNDELARWVRENAPSDAPGWELVAERLECMLDGSLDLGDA